MRLRTRIAVTALAALVPLAAAFGALFGIVRAQVVEGGLRQYAYAVAPGLRASCEAPPIASVGRSTSPRASARRPSFAVSRCTRTMRADGRDTRRRPLYRRRWSWRCGQASRTRAGATSGSRCWSLAPTLRASPDATTLTPQLLADVESAPGTVPSSLGGD
jgi:hypothetical protein